MSKKLKWRMEGELDLASIVKERMKDWDYKKAMEGAFYPDSSALERWILVRLRAEVFGGNCKIQTPELKESIQTARELIIEEKRAIMRKEAEMLRSRADTLEKQAKIY